MAREEDFQRDPVSTLTKSAPHPPTTTFYASNSSGPSNALLLSSWLALQSQGTRSAVVPADISYFNQHGSFPPRHVTTTTPSTLRLEIHDESTSHLPPGIRRPHIDVLPLTLHTMSWLLAVLRFRVSVPCLVRPGRIADTDPPLARFPTSTSTERIW